MPTGEDHPRAKVTKAQVLDICTSSENEAALAQKYGISRGHVSALRTGIAWKHLARPLRHREIVKLRTDFSVAELAYMAGLVDGEGTICIYEVGSKVRGKNYGASKTILQVYNCHRGCLEWIQARFGGRIGEVPRASAQWKRAYAWCAYHQQAVAIVRVILPFLIIKRRQAEIFIEYGATRKRWGVAGVPDEISAKREVWIAELKQLNARGRNALAL